jgi:hypothetical protein
LKHFTVQTSYLGIDLLAHFAADLASISTEQRQEALRPAVDHVDLVQADDVHYLLPLLQLALRTLNELGGRAWVKGGEGKHNKRRAGAKEVCMCNIEQKMMGSRGGGVGRSFV